MKFNKEFKVTKDHIDFNNHLSNVIYLTWMEELARAHTRLYNGFEVVNELGATWFAKTQHIDYFAQAFEGDEIVAETYIDSYTKVTAKRVYCFFEKKSGKKLVEAYTDWVYVDIESSKPRRMCSVATDYLKKSIED